MPKEGKILFLSDFHLGVPNAAESLQREKAIVALIEDHLPNLDHLYLMGDLFDFWFEYKTVVPKGFLRLLGCLAKVADHHVPITIFRGNHDVWMWDYFEKELGAKVYSEPVDVEHYGYRLHLHHGDGLGPGDHGYKFIKWVFNAAFFQFLFRWIHPDIGVALANYFSKKSSAKTRHKDLEFHGVNQEWIVQYCQEQLKHKNYDFMVFGHRHLPMDIRFNATGTRYINLGDWLHHRSYALLDNKGLRLLSPQSEPILGQVD